jgi:hypothetical protein
MKVSTIKYDYFVCERCEINTETEGATCPCYRGFCDAEKEGVVYVNKTIVHDKDIVKNADDDNLDDIGKILAKMNL